MYLTRTAAPSLDQKASGLIDAPTPSAVAPEWTSPEHTRAHPKRSRPPAVREELSHWTGPRMQAALGVVNQAALIDVTVRVRVRRAPARNSSHGSCTIWHPRRRASFKVDYAAHKIKDAARDRNRRH